MLKGLPVTTCWTICSHPVVISKSRITELALSPMTKYWPLVENTRAVTVFVWLLNTNCSRLAG